jgi:hypothetical protein
MFLAIPTWYFDDHAFTDSSNGYSPGRDVVRFQNHGSRTDWSTIVTG